LDFACDPAWWQGGWRVVSEDQRKMVTIAELFGRATLLLHQRIEREVASLSGFLGVPCVVRFGSRR